MIGRIDTVAVAAVTVVIIAITPAAAVGELQAIIEATVAWKREGEGA